MPPYLLAIDLGTSSTKVILVDLNGNIAGRSESEYPIQRPHIGYAEQDPDDWWKGVTSAVRRAVSKLPSGPINIAVIGLCGQMHGTVLLDASGRLVAPAVIWPDQRSLRQVEEITKLFGLADLVKITGSAPFAGFQAPTVRWFQQERPEIWSRVKRVLAPKDWLRWRLTGEISSEPSDGSGTLFLNVTSRKWSEEIISGLNIDPEVLPPIRGSKEVAGFLSEDSAGDLEIPAGRPVITGAADTACSILGAGIGDDKELLITISSGGQIAVPLNQVTLDLRGRVHTFCNALDPDEGRPGWYLNAAVLSAGLSFRWLRDNLLGLEGPQAFEKMTGWAAASPAGARGLIFLPYLSGERTPHIDPEARAIFLGLTIRHGRSEIIRSVMEGVALACYDAYSCLLDMGFNSASITLAGGGAKSLLWQQIFADVFSLPVRPLLVEEQSALGAAMLAGAGIGLIDIDDALGHWPKYGPQVEPNTATTEIYRMLFPIFRRTYAKNLGVVHALAELSDRLI